MKIVDASLAVVVLAACFTVGCQRGQAKPPHAPLGVAEAVTPEDEKKFDASVAYFEQGDLPKAEEGFSKFVEEPANEPMTDQARIYLARIAMEKGQLKDARELLEVVWNKGENAAYYDYASLYLGEVAFAEKDYVAVDSLVSSYIGRFPSPEDNELVLELLWESSRQRNWMNGIVRYGELFFAHQAADDGTSDVPENPDDTSGDVLAVVEASLAQADDIAQLKQLAAARQTHGPVWARVMGRITQLQYDGGEIKDAAASIREIKQARQDLRFLGPLIEILHNLNDVDMRTIGVLLPLTGGMRMIGQEALKGVMLGAKRFRFGEDGSPLSVVIKDTDGASGDIAATVRQLVEKDKVCAIIGPVSGPLARAAARAAQQHGVPMLGLTTDEGVSQLGEFVFRKFASNRLEAAALVASLEHLDTGADRVAVLYPDNGYGNLMKTLVGDLLARSGKKYAASVSFAADTRDYQQVVKQLNPRDFDVLYMPVSSGQAALLAPYLAAANIWSTSVDEAKQNGGTPPVSEGKLFLFPSVAYSAAVVERAGKYLQGAAFVSGFDKRRSAGAAGFARSYVNVYKAEPSVFGAYAYDAVVLIAQAVKSGVVSRTELRSWLANRRVDDNLSMVFSGFDEDGEASAMPSVFVLRDDGLEAP